METNRRNFIKGLIVAGAGFGILPGAGRVWTPRKLKDAVIVRFGANANDFLAYANPLEADWTTRKFLAVSGSWSDGISYVAFTATDETIGDVLKAHGLRARGWAHMV